MNLTEEQIRKGLKERLKKLEEQFKLIKEKIELCKTAQKAFGDNTSDPKDLQLSVFENAVGEDKIIISKDRITLRSKVEGLLSDVGRPMTSRDIMEHLNKTYKKKYSYNNFSGNFSVAYRKKSSNIEKYEFDDAPIDLRVVYGLKSWFIGNELKAEFKKGFYEAHSQ